MPVEVLSDFDFKTILVENEVYKVGIRNKGEALINIEDFNSLEKDRVGIILSKVRRLDQDNQNYVLVLRLMNEIYNIPVQIKERKKERNYILEKTGRVVYIKDRRDYKRIEMDKKVEYYTADNKKNINHLYTGVIKDISGSGAQLVTTRELDTSNPVVLNTAFLSLPLEELRGKIVWKEEGTSRKYYNGIQFQFSNSELQTKLVDYLYSEEDEKDN